MTLAKEEYRNELDGIRSFAKSLLKSNDPADKIKFKDAYERYADQRQLEFPPDDN